MLLVTVFVRVLACIGLVCSSFSQDMTSRINAYLSVGDPRGALHEVEQQLQKAPQDQALIRLQIRCLAAVPDIPGLLKVWNGWCQHNQTVDRALLEEVAWAIIRQAHVSPSPIIRSEATVAAFFANDAKGMDLCSQALQDSHVSLRMLAATLSGSMRDEQLQLQLQHIALHDPSPLVRNEAIRSLGQMHMQEHVEPLKQVLISESATLQEKMSSIEAIAESITNLDPALIQQLSVSNRAFCRYLACRLVLDQLATPHLALIIPCILDPTPEVRLMAIQCVGITREEFEENEAQMIAPLMSHQDIRTALCAAWYCLRYGQSADREQAKQHFRQWLVSADKTTRLWACASLAATGSRGVLLASDMCRLSNDPLVRLNLAIYLIWQREHLDVASDILASCLQNIEERLSWDSLGVFSFVAPTRSVHVEGIAQLPETEDLITRLELCSMLLAVGYKEISQLLKPFLRHHTWGVSGQAAFLLLQEDLQTTEAVEVLLTDPDEHVALQAAFLLAFYSKDAAALRVLEKQYPHASRQIKEQILSAIGAIGSCDMLAFLSQVLQEPSESLRVAAARAILLCLSH